MLIDFLSDRGVISMLLSRGCVIELNWDKKTNTIKFYEVFV